MLFERVLLTEACRGKGSTLFPSFQTVWKTCFVLLCVQLLCALACLYLCILVDENVVIICVQFTYDWENVCIL